MELADIQGGVAVTGALGNLGTKLLRHLASRGAKRLVGLDVRDASDDHVAAIRGAGSHVDVSFRACDLADPGDSRWREAFEEAGAVVHFAAQNPYPEATWGDATASVDMTNNTALAAAESATVKRYVFATSNHVMGRYLEVFGQEVGAGDLTTSIDPGVGTVWSTGAKDFDSTPYASAKWAGERLCRALGARSKDTTFVCVRIGWCQPGANRPDTLNASGTPTQARTDAGGDDELARIDRWFREMWLSNADLVRVFERALVADGRSWADGFALVNGMSNNAGMAWNLEAGRSAIGYEPVDDVYGNAGVRGPV